jgi:serine/threonine-protein kinase HipA
MTSEPEEVYVWVWLPDQTSPVVAGLLETVGDAYHFTYGTSYLDRPERFALYLPELPLGKGRQRPPPGMRVAGCITDAAPDIWGRRTTFSTRPALSRSSNIRWRRSGLNGPTRPRPAA